MNGALHCPGDTGQKGDVQVEITGRSREVSRDSPKLLKGLSAFDSRKQRTRLERSETMVSSCGLFWLEDPAPPGTLTPGLKQLSH